MSLKFNLYTVVDACTDRKVLIYIIDHILM